MIALSSVACVAFSGEALDLRAVGSFEVDSQLTREGNQLIIYLEDADAEVVLIPRIYASLKRINWTNTNSGAEITVQPEVDHWAIRWKGATPRDAAIALEFDMQPKLEGEIGPVEQLGDGRISLHAYQATTHGEKLRYEPQPHKNTVGYWVNAEDFATWKIQVEQPGKFNVGILQGCGPGQGGSVASLTIDREDHTIDELGFTVEETGHFQNFIWRTVGVVEILKPGLYTLKLQPKRIEKAALMDIRQMQLVRLP